MIIDVEKFQEVDIRVGSVQEVERIRFRKNSYIKLKIDFGPEAGVRTTVLNNSDNYVDGDFIARQVVGVVNIKPKKISGIFSDVLLLGADCENGNFGLLVPNRISCIGNKVY